MFYETFTQTAVNYFRAKAQFISDEFENQLTINSMSLMEKEEHLKFEDEKMKFKLDYMYNTFDYETDRSRIRDKFLTQMNKRISLKDIGETLDELVLDNKSKYNKYYRLNEHWNA